MADKWIQLMSEDGTDNLFPTSKMDLLWTNASTSSSFSGQTLNIDLSSYKRIFVLAKYDTSTPDSAGPSNTYGNAIGIIGYTAIKDGFAISMVNWSGSRYVQCTTSQIIFSNGYASGTGVANQYIIPLKIYGIK